MGCGAFHLKGSFIDAPMEHRTRPEGYSSRDCESISPDQIRLVVDAIEHFSRLRDCRVLQKSKHFVRLQDFCVGPRLKRTESTAGIRSIAPDCRKLSGASSHLRSNDTAELMNLTRLRLWPTLRGAFHPTMMFAD